MYRGITLYISLTIFLAGNIIEVNVENYNVIIIVKKILKIIFEE